MFSGIQEENAKKFHAIMFFLGISELGLLFKIYAKSTTTFGLPQIGLPSRCITQHFPCMEIRSSTNCGIIAHLLPSPATQSQQLVPQPHPAPGRYSDRHRLTPAQHNTAPNRHYSPAPLSLQDSASLRQALPHQDKPPGKKNK